MADRRALDYGQDLVIDVTGVSLADSTAVIRALLPSGKVKSWTPDTIDVGNNRVSYEIQDGDLPEKGSYEIQLVVVKNDLSVRTRTETAILDVGKGI